MQLRRGAPWLQAVTNADGQSYTVPANKTLVLCGVRVDVPTSAGTNSLSLNSVVLHAVTTIGSAATSKDGFVRLTEMPIKAGTQITFVTSGASVTGTLVGYLLDEI